MRFTVILFITILFFLSAIALVSVARGCDHCKGLPMSYPAYIDYIHCPGRKNAIFNMQEKVMWFIEWRDLEGKDFTAKHCGTFFDLIEYLSNSGGIVTKPFMIDEKEIKLEEEDENQGSYPHRTFRIPIPDTK